MESASSSGAPTPEKNHEQDSQEERSRLSELANTAMKAGRVAVLGFLAKRHENRADTQIADVYDANRDAELFASIDPKSLAQELDPRATAQLARANRIFGSTDDPNETRIGPINQRETRKARRQDPNAEVVRTPNKIQRKYAKRVTAAKEYATKLSEKPTELADLAESKKRGIEKDIEKARAKRERILDIQGQPVDSLPTIDRLTGGLRSLDSLKFGEKPVIKDDEKVDSIIADPSALKNMVNASHMQGIDLLVEAEFKRRLEKLGDIGNRERAAIHGLAVRTVLNAEASAAFSDTQSEAWLQRFNALNGLYNNYTLEKQKLADDDKGRGSRKERSENIDFRPESGLNVTQVRELDTKIQDSIKSEVGEMFKHEEDQPEAFHTVEGKTKIRPDVYNKLCEDVIFKHVRFVVGDIFDITQDMDEFKYKFEEVLADRNKYRSFLKSRKNKNS